MKKKIDMSGILLSTVTVVILLSAMLIRAFFARVILPDFGFSVIITISLLTLVLNHYLYKDRRKDYRFIPIYAAFVFGLFPWVSCFCAPIEALKSAVIGTLVFTVTSFVFDSIILRLSAAGASKAAPLISAFTLFLASECLMGII